MAPADREFGLEALAVKGPVIKFIIMPNSCVPKPRIQVDGARRTLFQRLRIASQTDEGKMSVDRRHWLTCTATPSFAFDPPQPPDGIIAESS